MNFTADTEDDPLQDGGHGRADMPSQPAADARAKRILREDLFGNCAYVERAGVPLYATKRMITHERKINGEPFTWVGPEWRLDVAKTMQERHAADLIEVMTDRGPKRNSVFDIWRKSPERRTYDCVGHFFKKPPPDALNLFTGWTVKPSKGSWRLFHDHLLNNVCQGNQEHANWLLDWLADIIQNPEIKRPSAVVLRSGQGTGKSKIGEWICALIGHAAIKLDKSGQVTGPYNDHQDGKLFVHVEEAAFAGVKAAAGILKDMVSSGSLTVHAKFKGIYEAPNSMRLMFCTNELHAMKIDADDRRYFILEVGTKRKNDHAYFAAIDSEMRNGGLAAMLYDFERRQITSNLASPPKTAAHARQKELSLSPLMQAAKRMIEAGSLRDRDSVVVTLPDDDRYERVDRARFDDALTAAAGGMRPSTQDLADLRKKCGIRTIRPKSSGGAGRPYLYEIPSASVMQGNLAESLGCDVSDIFANADDVDGGEL